MKIVVRPGSRDGDPKDIEIVQWNVTSKTINLSLILL